MPWTQASEVENDNEWAGRCNELDIFELIDPIPPDEFEDVLTTDDDILILEGFELSDEYVDGSQSEIFELFTATGTPFSISVENRGATITAGKSLKVIGTDAVGGQLRFPIKITGQTYQYYRMYVMFETLTNANGNDRTIPLFGWVDSTGFRSHAALAYLAGGTVKWQVRQNTLVGETTSAVSPTTDVWYRCELVTENLAASGGMDSTLYVYEDDTDTLLTEITVHNSGAAMGGFPFVGASTLNTSNAITAYFDDTRIQTATPTAPVAPVGGPLFGPGGIWPMVPEADFVSEWTPLLGENFENVNEFPLSSDEDTTYVSSSGASQVRDLYSIEYVPDTIPNGKYIKAVQVRATIKRPAGGGGNPQAACLYQSPLETVFSGPNRGIEDNTYLGYPWNSVSGNNRMPQAFLFYVPGLPTGFRNQHKIGIQRPASSPTPASRVTAVWGYVEVSANV